MDMHRDQRLRELRHAIERGDYTIEPDRVADSIVRCVAALELARGDARRPVAVVPPRRRARRRLRAAAAARWRRVKTPVVAALG